MDINDHITNIIVEAWDGSPLEYEAIPLNSGIGVVNLYINKIFNDGREQLNKEDLSDEELGADIFEDEETGREYMVLGINDEHLSTIGSHKTPLNPLKLMDIIDKLEEFKSKCTARR